MRPMALLKPPLAVMIGVSLLMLSTLFLLYEKTASEDHLKSFLMIFLVDKVTSKPLF